MSVYRERMQRRIGRPLKKDEVVHHIDGNRANNDDHNLAVMTRRAHCRLHARENKLLGPAIKWAGTLAAAEIEDAAKRASAAAQTRAARAMLGWSQRDLKDKAGAAFRR